MGVFSGGIERKGGIMDGGIAKDSKPSGREHLIKRIRAGKLTDLELKAWLAKASAGDTLPFGGNLRLELSKVRTPLWLQAYRIFKTDRAKIVEDTYSHGAYPDVGIADALEGRAKVKSWLREGRDPRKARDEEREGARYADDSTLRHIAEDWLEASRVKWSPIHYTKSKQALEAKILRELGHMPVASITSGMIAKRLAPIAKKTPDTAAKVLQHITAVFDYAKGYDLCGENPATAVYEVLRASRPSRSTTHRPALLTWPELGAVMRAAEAARLSPAVRLAHRLCAFTAARISNVVEAEWSEFHLEDEPPVWIIPRAKMKARDRSHDHRVILGPTIAEELRDWRRTIGGRGFVFPSPASREDAAAHITRESIEKCYRETLKLRDKHSPHGWRSAFSSLARNAEINEGKRHVPRFTREVVELVLDHIHDSDVARAYDREPNRIEQRVELMRWWDAELSQAQRGAEVIPISATATT
jgi:integrase